LGVTVKSLNQSAGRGLVQAAVFQVTLSVSTFFPSAVLSFAYVRVMLLLETAEARVNLTVLASNITAVVTEIAEPLSSTNQISLARVQLEARFELAVKSTSI